MPLDLLFRCGLLLVAVVVAFATAAAVGYVVALLSAVPRPRRGAPREAHRQPSPPDYVPAVPTERPPIETLAPVTDTAT